MKPSLGTFVFFFLALFLLLGAAEELSPPVNVRPPLALRHDRRHGLVEHGGIDLQHLISLSPDYEHLYLFSESQN